MKYRINKDTFMFREEDENTISLIVKATNKILFLNQTAALIIRTAEEISDTRDLLKMVDFPNETSQNVEEDFIDTINLLHAYGIADILDETIEEINKIDIAGERDYYRIANFIKENAKNPLNHMAIKSIDYFDVISIRDRQFNNLEYNFLQYDKGEIIADVVIGVPMAGSIFSVLSINSVFFKIGIEEEKIKEILKNIFAFVISNFKERFNKIRFYYYPGAMGGLKNLYHELGFELVCTYKNEINKSIDMEVWDKIF